VIEVMKEEAAKRSAAAAAKADDSDKRKWMSTAQLWVDSRATDADPVVVRFLLLFPLGRPSPPSIFVCLLVVTNYYTIPVKELQS
jgi:Holliday junction resolvase-like predicted endonuclease